MREGWGRQKLAQASEVVMGQSPSGSSYNESGEGLPFLQGSAEFGEKHPAPVKWCSEPRKIAHAGDILMSVRAPVGDINLADRDTAIGRGLAILRAGPDLDQGYLKLAAESATDELTRSSSTGMFASITKTGLANIEISVPPLHEQRRIVDLIGAVDDAIEAAMETEESSREALDLLRDQTIWRLKERVILGELCNISSKLVDPTLGEHSSLLHIGTDRIVSGTGDIEGAVTAAADGVISGKFKHTGEDIVYSKIRPNLRKVCIPNYEGLCSADAYPLRPKHGVNPQFLKHLLLSRPFTEDAVARSGRTKMPKINKTELFSISVPTTSREEQSQLGALFESLDESRRASKIHADSLRAVRSNLLSALLSGAHEIPDTYDEVMGTVA